MRLADISYDLGHDQPLDQALQVIARGIHDSTPFLVVLISMAEADTGLLRRVTAIGIPKEALNELQSRKQSLQSLVQLMKPEFKISCSYFIPSDQSPLNETDEAVVAPETSTYTPQNPNAWNVNDTLLVPLEDAEGQVVGLISLDHPLNGLRPDKATIETVEVFAAQAALLVNNTLRQGELRSRIDALSSGLQRQQRLIDNTQNNLPILLHKDLEHTISLYNLDQRTQCARRTAGRWCGSTANVKGLPMKTMPLKRIRELRKELDNERISYGELHEIDCAADAAGIKVTDDMLAGEILDELEVIAKAK